MNDWFNERYIKETPIEEQIRGQVRAECHYMDKVDIYEWITQNEIKIMNLQSKIDKANDKLEDIKMMSEFDNCKANMILNEVQEILEEDK